MRGILLLALLFATSAFGQYKGPAVESCLAYAKRDVARDGTRAKDVLFERDANLMIERYTRKVGNQFVSSILRGNAAIVLEGSPSIELSFTCLLADDKTAVFFDWLPRANVAALTQCTRDSGLRDQPKPCLELLLQVAENDLTQSYAVLFQEARERDHDAGNENAVGAFRKANEEWRQYREAECARRQEQRKPGANPDLARMNCMVELTRRRALDVR